LRVESHHPPQLDRVDLDEAACLKIADPCAAAEDELLGVLRAAGSGLPTLEERIERLVKCIRLARVAAVHGPEGGPPAARAWTRCHTREAELLVDPVERAARRGDRRAPFVERRILEFRCEDAHCVAESALEVGGGGRVRLDDDDAWLRSTLEQSAVAYRAPAPISRVGVPGARQQRSTSMSNSSAG
jgi:hypothetical protein